MSFLVGVDIGGTSVKLGLIQCGEAFAVEKLSSIPTQPGDPAEVFAKRIAAAVKELAAGHKVDGIGVGCPGLIDPWKGVVRTSPNLKNLPGFELKASLVKHTGLSVEIQNDANAAVLGEWLFSPASKDVKNLILLTLGTGVGGGVVCDGHLLVGADNAATELGHLKVEYNDGAPCGCGKQGCIEAYAGAAGIVRVARQKIAKGEKTSLTGDFTTKEISIAASLGDKVAKATLFAVGVYLGRGVAHLLETFNPEKVILGGGASAAIEHLMPGINAALDQTSSFAFTRNRCKIERSAFPDNINVIGAAATYLNAHQK